MIGVGLLPDDDDQRDLLATLTPPRKKHNPETFYGLPPAVREIYLRRGVQQLYDWQDSVLCSSAVSSGQNFVYSLPTSGGKTIVAEMMMLRAILNQRRTAIFILPFVAIADEKTCAFQRFGEMLGFHVEGYFGSVGRLPPPEAPAACICTIEKANSLINQYARLGRSQEIGCVVVDELHMIGDGRRGILLESLLAKLLTFCSAQIIGMSATIPNLPEIAHWLRAEYLIGDFRPVPLDQYIVCQGTVSDQHGQVRQLNATTEMDCITTLVSESTGSVLVFCSSRSQTIETAKRIADALGTSAHERRAQRLQLQAEMKSMDGYEKTLAQLVVGGIAYHHGGLLAEERRLIELAFQSRVINVICCTSTLAAGVNLPARRVIIRSPFIGRELLPKSMYLQMCGRAGRAGLDDRGEAFLVTAAKDKLRSLHLIERPTESVSSGFPREPLDTFARYALEVVSSGSCNSIPALAKFFANTFHGARASEADTIEWAVASIGVLQQSAAIRVSGEEFTASGFGTASVRACFSLDDARFIRHELQDVQKFGLILDDDLHVCYFLTPVQDLVEPNWAVYETLLRALPESKQRVAARLAINERLIAQFAAGLLNPRPSSDQEKREHFTVRRFFSAMMLAELLVETPMHVVESRYQVNRGNVQALMKSAAIFSSSICSFCQSLEWFGLEAVLAAYVKRLGYGVKPDVVPLMEINGVTASRARALWNAGYKNVKAIAEELPDKLRDTVRRANPDSRSAKYFSSRAAAALIRAAHTLIHASVNEKRQEIELLTGSTQIP
jgi:POLQ-like helicase